MKNTHSILCALCVLTSSVSAQVGTWKSYTDMKSIRDLTIVEGKIWAATSGGVFTYDPVQKKFDIFTNVDGLTTINVTAIASDEAGRVYVGAANGYIDIYDPRLRSWTTIPDIARATSKPQRGINKFVPVGDKMYIATDFGVVVFSQSRREFGDAYGTFGQLPSPVKVNDVYFRNDEIWVATDKGVAQASLGAVNLQEPSNWKTYTTSDGLPSSNILSLSGFNNAIVAGTASGAAYLSGGSWNTIALPNRTTSILRLMMKSPDTMYLTTSDAIYEMKSFTDVTTYISAKDFALPSNPGFTSLRFMDQQFTIIGTSGGISIIDNLISPPQLPTLLKPDGPNSNQFIGLSVDESGILWSGSGRDAAGRGIYSFDGVLWTNYTKESHPVINSDSYVKSNRGANGSRWFNSWGDGLLLLRSNGMFTSYRASNVTGFPGVGSSLNFNVTYNSTIDSKGTTWTVHYRGSNQVILSAFTADSSWTFFRNLATPGDEVTKVIVDIYGSKWIVINDGVYRGIIIFNENGSLKDLSDDKWSAISAVDPTGINASVVTDIVSDLTGDIWIGTDVGLRTIFNPRDPGRITRTCNNTRCNIEGQYINSIAIDALNNKWIGTRSGVYVLAPDGSAVLAQYNNANSPLLDNDVKSIVVHPKTGVAYFGTDQGLSSLQTTSVEPKESFSGLLISPNPFHPEQDRTATIDGLVEGSSLKILSVDGSVIADVGTPGGRIGFWDGRTNDGHFAPTGVYFIAAYSPDGSKVGLGKIAVIR